MLTAEFGLTRRGVSSTLAAICVQCKYQFQLHVHTLCVARTTVGVRERRNMGFLNALSYTDSQKVDMLEAIPPVALPEAHLSRQVHFTV